MLYGRYTHTYLLWLTSLTVMHDKINIYNIDPLHLYNNTNWDAEGVQYVNGAMVPIDRCIK